MMIILDCDSVSILAKVNRFDILDKAFPGARFCITNSVYIELLRAKRAGYSFPDMVFEYFPVIAMDREDLKAFQNISKQSMVHDGEAEGLSICQEKNATFLTNDHQAIIFAERYGINALDMKDLLTLLAIRQIQTYDEMISLIEDIEIRDNTCVKYKDKIMARYERNGL